MNELSENIQTDICTCCDGVLENEIPADVLERLKTLLCNIVVQKINSI